MNAHVLGSGPVARANGDNATPSLCRPRRPAPARLCVSRTVRVVARGSHMASPALKSSGPWTGRGAWLARGLSSRSSSLPLEAPLDDCDTCARPVLARVCAVPTEVDADALQKARANRGLTQNQLARIIDVSGGERVSEWERGVRTPAVRLIPQLAAVLGVTPLEFLALPNGVDLKALRLAVGKTSAEVAAEVHVSPATNLRWESGRVPVGEGPGLRSRLARALHVSRAGLEAAVGTIRRSPGD